MNDVNKMTKALKALANEKRLKIIDLLACGKMCCYDFTEELDLSQPNVSHHLKVLKDVGLLKIEKRGKWVDYELNTKKLNKLITDLDGLVNKKHHRCEFSRNNCTNKCD